jgi:hypothetical protein
MLLAPGVAYAAPSETWDALAQCESGQRWQLDSGNGFYGGLQFTYASWVGAGGTVYAWRADYATRSQQIEIAENLLSLQGWQAWPTCRRILGLW